MLLPAMDNLYPMPDVYHYNYYVSEITKNEIETGLEAHFGSVLHCDCESQASLLNLSTVSVT